MSTTISPVDSGPESKPVIPKPTKSAQFPAHYPNGLDWPTVFWISVVHLGLLAAPFTFSWSGLAIMFVLYWLTGGIGICLGYHRLFSHRSFATPKAIRWIIALVGGLAGEGSAIHWGANHRRHHALSDTPGDPHSPREGFLWSHCLWCLGYIPAKERAQYHAHWVPDLAGDPVLRFLDRTYLWWHIGLGAALFGAGYAVGGSSLGWSYVVWGVFVRMAVVLHATWCINSVTHVWGYKTYDNGDDSKNLWWVALFTFGEGWHNNHHAHPRVANYGHRWWELDTTYMTIWLMSKLGLASDIASFRQHRQQ